MSTSTVLDEIIVGVREDLTQRMEQVPLGRVKELALAAEPARDALAALHGDGAKVRIISEVFFPVEGCLGGHPGSCGACG